MDISIEGRNVHFGGFLNERSDLAPVRAALDQAHVAAGNARVIIDFSKIEKANSVGILGYIKTLKGLSLPILYTNVPIWLVEQFNIVQEFFEGDVVVDSLFARFYCPDTDGMTTRLLKIGSDLPILSDYSDYEPSFQDLEGHRWEADFDPPSYFDFIVHFGERFRENLS